MRKGFVINEMLIALMIILVLAGGYMLNTNWMHGLAEEKADAQTAASLGMLVTQYKLHMGAYPSKLADLTKKNAAGYGPYISEIPKDSYGNNFSYTYNNTGFAIWGNGENGKNDSGNGLTSFSGDDAGVKGF